MSKAMENKTGAHVRSFKPYPSYKDSGVEWLGKVPKQWNAHRLKYCVELINDKVDGDATDLPYTGMEHVESWTGKRLSANGIPATSEGQANRFRAGDVLFGKLRPYLAKVLRAAEEGICTGELLVMRPKTAIQDYLFNYLLAKDFITVVDGSTYGAKMPRASWEFIGNLPMLLPPDVEQRCIAAFLDRETARIDQLIAKKERQIELLQEKRSALISHAVTKGLNPKARMKDSGIEWLGEIPEHWEVLPLKRLLARRSDAVKTGPFGSQLLSSEMLTGEIKVYNQKNVISRDFESGENYITSEKYEELKAFTIMRGDVLVTTRGTIGRCALFPDYAEDGILHPCLMRVQTDRQKLLREYLAMLIQDGDIVQLQLSLMSNSTTIEVIYSESLKNVFVPTPPVDEQRAILSKVCADMAWIEQLLGKVADSIDKLREYRTALISAAVTGKIDVREEATA